MSLERVSAAAAAKTIYTCPMHPEVDRDEPGDCPICGMRLEPQLVPLGDHAEDAELGDMTRRFWVGLVLTIPLFVVTMAEMFGIPSSRWIPSSVSGWIQLA